MMLPSNQVNSYQDSIITFSFFQVRTYVHIFDSCSQDWFAVASILENVASELTRTAPQLKEIYLRSDNAGCYHNASLLVSAPVIISKKGLTLRDYSFSEANSGKDVCDRKIAPLKAHIERYLNEGKIIFQCGTISLIVLGHFWMSKSRPDLVWLINYDHVVLNKCHISSCNLNLFCHFGRSRCYNGCTAKRGNRFQWGSKRLLVGSVSARLHQARSFRAYKVGWN